MLVVEMSGSPSMHDTRAMFGEVVGMAAVKRALLVCRTNGCLNLADTMELVTALPRMGFPGDYRIALLMTDESMRATSQFAEDVAVNRGIALHTFSDRAAAIEWLSRP